MKAKEINQFWDFQEQRDSIFVFFYQWCLFAGYQPHWEGYQTQNWPGGSLQLSLKNKEKAGFYILSMKSHHYGL